VLFLGLSIALELREAISSGARVSPIATGAGLLLSAGILIRAPASALPLPYLTAVFAFSLIALLYLGLEELLVEAHTGPDSPFIAALFFVGFLLLLVLEEKACDVSNGWREDESVIRLMLVAAAAILLVRMIRRELRSTYDMVKERSRRNRTFRLRHPSLSA
jgi:hypothetical protein